MSTFFLTAILVGVGVVGMITAIGAIGVSSFVLTMGPPAFRLMIAAHLCLTVFIEIAIVVSRPLAVFDNGTQVVTVLVSTFAAFGALVSTYFGIQARSQTADRSQEAIEKANHIANWIRSESDPEAGGKAVRDEDRATLKNLADLYVEGILTEEEFANAKSRLMHK